MELFRQFLLIDSNRCSLLSRRQNVFDFHNTRRSHRKHVNIWKPIDGTERSDLKRMRYLHWRSRSSMTQCHSEELHRGS